MGKKVGVKKEDWDGKLRTLKSAGDSVHAVNGMKQPSGSLNVKDLKQVWDAYDQLTNAMTQLESMMENDLGQLKQVGDNQVALDQSYSK